MRVPPVPRFWGPVMTLRRWVCDNGARRHLFNTLVFSTIPFHLQRTRCGALYFKSRQFGVARVSILRPGIRSQSRL